MTLALAWLAIFRRALLAGATLGLAFSLAFVLSAPTLPELTREPHAAVASSGPVEVGAVRASVRGNLVIPAYGHGLRSHALARTTEASSAVGDRRAASAARSAYASDRLGHESPPRSILIPRGSPITVDRDEQDVELAIVEAAREFCQDPAVMLCVARAESTLRTNVLGHSGERGPMQFMPRTWGYFERTPDGTARWTGNSARLGYSEQDVWLAIPAARVAASMWARGQQGAWSTYAGCAR